MVVIDIGALSDNRRHKYSCQITNMNVERNVLFSSRKGQCGHCKKVSAGLLPNKLSRQDATFRIQRPDDRQETCSRPRFKRSKSLIVQAYRKLLIPAMSAHIKLHHSPLRTQLPTVHLQHRANEAGMSKMAAYKDDADYEHDGRRKRC
jgi:hypothetical protein